LLGVVTAALAAQCGLDPAEVSSEQSFADTGLSSRGAIAMSAELSSTLARNVPVALLYEYPSPARLAAALAGGDGGSEVGYRSQAPGEAVAVIGIGCRFPGAHGPTALWSLLEAGIDAVREVPEARWNADDYYDPERETPGRMNSRWGGFLDGVDQFDAGFFGISPREASQMDPQHRLLLMTAYEALEDAQLRAEDLAGSMTGVFVGISTNDYGHALTQDLARMDGYGAIGNAGSLAANRLSYTLDLRGPSLSVDTACSSSLTAVHLANQALRRGECSLAICGGVNLILSPATGISVSKAGATSPTGRCRAFSADADGYVRSEGVGVVILKSLRAALRDANRIYCTLYGSATNQDGRTNGIYAPNGRAQREVIRSALHDARVEPASIQYVETHGTGTLLGDPIEAGALGAELGSQSTLERCFIGSVKSNFGHLEAAAGIAGLIKVALSIRNRRLPRSLHFGAPNPHIDFDRLGLAVVDAPRAWPEPRHGLRFAGVSSFGFGGSNAHVVVGEPSHEAQGATTSEVTCGPWLLPLSAHSDAALRKTAERYAGYLGSEGAPQLASVAATLATHRTLRSHRLVVVAQSNSEAVDRLDAWLTHGESPLAAEGIVARKLRRKVAFVFSGQGSQWARMGVDLCRQEPVFARALEACASEIQRQSGYDLLEHLQASEQARRLEALDVVQPAIFALQIALAALWRSWGVEPDIVIGSSMGEVAAACVSGGLSLRDASAVICRRSSLLRAVSGVGTMAHVALSSDQAMVAIAGHADRVSIAVESGSSSVVLSGMAEALKEVIDTLTSRGVRCDWVKGARAAGHSPQMDPLMPELVDRLADITPRPGPVSFFSTVERALVHGESLGATYWARNMREPVLFYSAICALLEDGVDTFIEVSPHPLLLTDIGEAIRDRGMPRAITLPSLRRGRGDRQQLLESAARLVTAGGRVNWRSLLGNSQQPVELPLYAWDCRPHWYRTDERSTTAPAILRSQSAAAHPLLGHGIPCPELADAYRWLGAIDSAVHPYLIDHALDGSPLLPGAAFAEMMLAASRSAPGDQAWALQNVAFEAMLPVHHGSPRPTQLFVRAAATGLREVSIFAADASGAFRRHATGSLARDSADPIALSTLAEARIDCNRSVDIEALYQSFEARGMDYGPAFRTLRDVWVGSDAALGRVELQSRLQHSGRLYSIHPTLLDGAFQLLAATSFEHEEDGGAWLPVGIERISTFGSGARELWVHGRWRQVGGSRQRLADLDLYEPDGTLYGSVRGLGVRRLPSKAVAPAASPYFVPVWSRRPRLANEAVRDVAGAWLICAADARTESLLTSTLRAQRIEGARASGGMRAAISSIESGDPVRGVVCVVDDRTWSAECDLGGAIRSLMSDFLDLLRRVLERAKEQRPELWLVTVGQEDAGEAPPLSALVAGVANVAMIEHRDLSCAHVDLSGSIEADASELAAEILAGPAEPDCRLRGASRFVRRLERLTLPASEVKRPGSLHGRVELDGDVVIPCTAGVAPDSPLVPAVVAHAKGAARKVGSIAIMTTRDDGAPADSALIMLLPVEDGEDPAALSHELERRVQIQYAIEDVARVMPGERVLPIEAHSDLARTLRQLSVGKDWSVLERHEAAVVHEADVVVVGEAGVSPADLCARLAPLGRVVFMPESGPTPGDVGLLVAAGHSVASVSWQSLRRAEPDRLRRHLERALRALRTAADAPARARVAHVGLLQPRADGVYIVTGGLGGLGRAHARRLVERGARCVVLVTRQQPDPATIAAASALGLEHAHVVVEQADVADRSAVRRLIANCRALGPIRGIVHGAGVLADGVLATLGLEEFERVIAPKAIGAWNLHLETRDEPLDFFMMLSSAASLLGSPGQANYTAANAFVDTLAHRRRADGRVATSVNWGPWADVGLAAADARRGERLARLGIASFSPERALDLLEAAADTRATQIAVLDIDLERWTSVSPTGREAPLLRELLGSGGGDNGSSRGALARALRGCGSWSEAREMLESQIQAFLALALGVVAADVDPKSPLTELGLDSLLAVELRNRLERDLDLELSATLVWAHPTVDAIGVRMLDMIGITAPVVEGACEPAAADASTEALELVRELSDEQVAALLEQRLSGTEENANP
jgi:acyl transferase domain-containing protein/NADP-dependent 3-hydroxy acid dehydrogenase YdfG/acyl carrier protein